MNKHFFSLFMLVLLSGLCALGGDVPSPGVGEDEQPVLVPQTGNGNVVTSIAISNDGNLLASIDISGMIVIWDIELGIQRRVMSSSLGRGSALFFQPDNRTLVCSGRYITRIDVISGKQMDIQSTCSDPLSAALSPDGSLLAYAMHNKVILHNFINNSDNTITINEILPYNPIHVIAFNPDGNTMAVGDEKGMISVWDINKHSKLQSFVGHSKQIAKLIYTNNGKKLISSSQDKTIIIWDPITAKQIDIIRTDNWASCYSITISPDGKALAYGSNGNILLYDIEHKNTLATLNGNNGYVGCVLQLVFRCDGRLLVSIGEGYSIDLWDIDAKQRNGTLMGSLRPIELFALSSSGKILAVKYGSPDIVLISTDNWEPRMITPSIVTQSSITNPCASMVFSPDDKMIAIGTYYGDIFVINAMTGEHITRFQLQSDLDPAKRKPITTIYFSNDVRYLTAINSIGIGMKWEILSNAVCENIRLPDIGLPFTYSVNSNRLRLKKISEHGDFMNIITGERIAIPGNETLQEIDSNYIFSNDRKLFAKYFGEEVNICATTTGKVIGNNTRIESGVISSLEFTKDNQLLFIGTKPGVIEVWDIAQQRRLISIFSIFNYYNAPAFVRQYSHLITTPQGYYTSSLEAAGKLVWRIKGEVYPFDLFSDKFNRPDLVKKALAGEDISNAPPLDNTQIPPKVQFLTPKYGAEIAGTAVDVTLEASGRVPIQRVEVTVNGQPLPADVAKSLNQPSTGTKQRYALNIPLPPNEPRVRLRAQAYDTASLKSRVDELTVFRPGVQAGVGTLYVLAVGIDRYTRPDIPRLRSAAADATALAAALHTQGGGKPYATVKTTTLTDAQATVSNLLFALRQLKDSATENDVVVVFFAGHGIMWQNNFYLASCDQNRTNIPGTALDWQQVVATLRDVRAKRVLVLADTCHAGGIVGDRPADNDELARKLNKNAHRLVFTAATRDEVSFERAEWGHGAFTKALLEALAGKADANTDGHVTFQELRDYVPTRVAELTDNRQHPQLPFLDQFEPDAVFAHVGK